MNALVTHKKEQEDQKHHKHKNEGSLLEFYASFHE
jgi:hypothetical protein